MTNFEPKNFKLYIPTDFKQQTVVFWLYASVNTRAFNLE